MPNKPTTLRELREKWLDFWYKESQNCEQKYLTPDTHGIIIDFLTSHSTELLKKIEEEIVEIRKIWEQYDEYEKIINMAKIETFEKVINLINQEK